MEEEEASNPASRLLFRTAIHGPEIMPKVHDRSGIAKPRLRGGADAPPRYESFAYQR
jgi:hypothetical protein